MGPHIKWLLSILLLLATVNDRTDAFTPSLDSTEIEIDKLVSSNAQTTSNVVQQPESTTNIVEQIKNIVNEANTTTDEFQLIGDKDDIEASGSDDGKIQHEELIVEFGTEENTKSRIVEIEDGAAATEVPLVQDEADEELHGILTDLRQLELADKNEEEVNDATADVDEDDKSVSVDDSLTIVSAENDTEVTTVSPGSNESLKEIEHSAIEENISYVSIQSEENSAAKRTLSESNESTLESHEEIGNSTVAKPSTPPAEDMVEHVAPLKMVNPETTANPLLSILGLPTLPALSENELIPEIVSTVITGAPTISTTERPRLKFIIPTDAPRLKQLLQKPYNRQMRTLAHLATDLLDENGYQNDSEDSTVEEKSSVVDESADDADSGLQRIDSNNKSDLVKSESESESEQVDSNDKSSKNGSSGNNSDSSENSNENSNASNHKESVEESKSSDDATVNLSRDSSEETESRKDIVEDSKSSDERIKSDSSEETARSGSAEISDVETQTTSTFAPTTIAENNESSAEDSKVSNLNESSSNEDQSTIHKEDSSEESIEKRKNSSSNEASNSSEASEDTKKSDEQPHAAEIETSNQESVEQSGPSAESKENLHEATSDDELVPEIILPNTTLIPISPTTNDPAEANSLETSKNNVPEGRSLEIEITSTETTSLPVTEEVLLNVTSTNPGDGHHQVTKKPGVSENAESFEGEQILPANVTDSTEHFESRSDETTETTTSEQVSITESNSIGPQETSENEPENETSTVVDEIEVQTVPNVPDVDLVPEAGPIGTNEDIKQDNQHVATVDITIDHIEVAHETSSIAVDAESATTEASSVEKAAPITKESRSVDDSVLTSAETSATPSPSEDASEANTTPFHVNEIVAAGLGSSTRSTTIILVCTAAGIMFLGFCATVFLISFQRQHGTLDIEMQEQHCGKDTDDEEDDTEHEDETRHTLLTQPQSENSTSDDGL